jgi:putative PIN family toxin of toxin-antitoxin system
MRLVLDTSVLVAAIRSDTGAAKAIVDLVLARQVILLMNYPIACEYREVTLRPQHVVESNLSSGEIVQLIHELETVASPVEIVESYRPLSTDPNDDLLLDLAINGRADMIVTNNLRHLQRPAARFGIEVLDARNALSTIREEGLYGTTPTEAR